jgi:hypothetical protein
MPVFQAELAHASQGQAGMAVRVKMGQPRKPPENNKEDFAALEEGAIYARARSGISRIIAHSNWLTFLQHLEAIGFEMKLQQRCKNGRIAAKAAVLPSFE